MKAKGKLLQGKINLELKTVNPRALYREEQGLGEPSRHDPAHLFSWGFFSTIHVQFNIKPQLGERWFCRISGSDHWLATCSR